MASGGTDGRGGREGSLALADRRRIVASGPPKSERRDRPLEALPVRVCASLAKFGKDTTRHAFFISNPLKTESKLWFFLIDLSLPLLYER